MNYLETRFVQGCCSVPFFPFLYFLAGYNFDERGPAAITCFVFTLFLFLIVMFRSEIYEVITE